MRKRQQTDYEKNKKGDKKNRENQVTLQTASNTRPTDNTVNVELHHPTPLWIFFVFLVPSIHVLTFYSLICKL